MPELPPPLPPGERTVGQLIAETIRLYGDNFWRALPLGLPIAVLDQLDLGRGGGVRIALFVACAPFLAFAFAYACALAGKVAARARGRSPSATAIGTLVLLPASLVFTWFALIAAVYLAFVGLAVPVAVLERTGAARRRCAARCELGRADYVHALGSIAALVVVFFLSRQVLVSLLQRPGRRDDPRRDLPRRPRARAADAARDGDALFRPGGAGRHRPQAARTRRRRRRRALTREPPRQAARGR